MIMLAKAELHTWHFTQVAFVVPDLDYAVRNWTNTFGIAPWEGRRLHPGIMKDMVYRGEPASFSQRYAVTSMGPLQFELLEPIGESNILADHLRDHGPGLHHLGVYVSNHDISVEAAVAKGYVLLQSARGFGVDGDGAFSYLEAPGIAPIIEVIERPFRRVAPEFVYPMDMARSC